jgi:hypothetical protein
MAAIIVGDDSGRHYRPRTYVLQRRLTRWMPASNHRGGNCCAMVPGLPEGVSPFTLAPGVGIP